MHKNIIIPDARSAGPSEVGCLHVRVCKKGQRYYAVRLVSVYSVRSNKPTKLSDMKEINAESFGRSKERKIRSKQTRLDQKVCFAAFFLFFILLLRYFT